MGDEVQAALLQEQAGELLPPSALPSLSIQRRQRNSKLLVSSRKRRHINVVPCINFSFG